MLISDTSRCVAGVQMTLYVMKAEHGRVMLLYGLQQLHSVVMVHLAAHTLSLRQWRDSRACTSSNPGKD